MMVDRNIIPSIDLSAIIQTHRYVLLDRKTTQDEMMTSIVSPSPIQPIRGEIYLVNFDPKIEIDRDYTAIESLSISMQRLLQIDRLNCFDRNYATP
jgi:hypothetical protein